MAYEYSEEIDELLDTIKTTVDCALRARLTKKPYKYLQVDDRFNSINAISHLDQEQVIEELTEYSHFLIRRNTFLFVLNMVALFLVCLMIFANRMCSK